MGNLDSIGEDATAMPTLSPTRTPTYNPTQKPQSKPPTFNPTHPPSRIPTKTPTISPTSNPTKSPTPLPTETPTKDPDTTRFVGNFDSTDKATYFYSSGTYEIASNPDPSDINQSSLAVRYKRNPSTQYDVIIYDSSSISSLDLIAFLNGNKKLCVDVLTSANQALTMQLEDSNLASPSNYPSGRHSRYTIDLQSSSTWQHYCFQFLDRPDTSVTLADKIVLLFGPNTFTNDAYYFDNLDSIGEDATAMPTLSPTRTPTYNPTHPPSRIPTKTPTISPTSNPTKSPTPLPTETPTKDPDTTRFVGNFDSTDQATYVYS